MPTGEVHAALERERERQAVEIDLILAAAAGPDRDAAVRMARETVAMLTRDPGGDR